MYGTVISNYRVLDELERGGMGVLYRAEHVTMGQLAVIKRLLPEYTTSPEIVARFFQEARAAASIGDPGIVRMFDQGTLADGSAYIIMELLPGESLGKRLRRGALQPELAVAVVRQAARVLAAAHRNRIVHRDLKPDNLFLVPDPEVAVGTRVKVLDFGIAKLMGEAGAGSMKTRTGLPMGTPDYMAPEQWRSAGHVDERADIYAMGCILFETLTGRRPFLGPGLPEFMDQHRFDAPPAPSAFDPRLAGFDSIVRRAMAKAPEDRFSSMEAFGNAVGALGRPSHETPVAPPPPTHVAAPQPQPHQQPLSPPPYSGPGFQPSTTLGSATAERMGHPVPPRRGRGLWIGLGAVVILGGATTAALLAGSDGGQPGQSPSPPQPAAPTPAGGFGPAAGPGPAAPPGGAAEAPGLAALAKDAGSPAVDDGWVRIGPPARSILLGVTDRGGGIAADVYGMRPGAELLAPADAYEIQAHEVTWGTLEPWLRAHPEQAVDRPAYFADTAVQKLPATGMRWAVADAYCRDLGGRLPSEAEWEYAARGDERRPYAWGTAPLESSATRVYAGPDARPVDVGSSAQDVTPNGIHDLMGNAQEWVDGAWREDDGTPGPATLRVVRGLPLAEEMPASLPAEGAAYRDRMCGDDCARDWKQRAAAVGFRCVRAAR